MKSLHNQFLITLLGMALLATYGCSFGKSGPQTGTVQGIISLNGKPLPQGTIQFFSNDTASGANAAIDENGHYQISAIPVGKFQVQIRPPALDPEQAAKGVVLPPMKLPIPSKYNNFSTSGLEFDVQAGENEYNITL